MAMTAHQLKQIAPLFREFSNAMTDYYKAFGIDAAAQCDIPLYDAEKKMPETGSLSIGVVPHAATGMIRVVALENNIPVDMHSINGKADGDVTCSFPLQRLTEKNLRSMTKTVRELARTKRNRMIFADQIKNHASTSQYAHEHRAIQNSLSYGKTLTPQDVHDLGGLIGTYSSEFTSHGVQTSQSKLTPGKLEISRLPDEAIPSIKECLTQAGIAHSLQPDSTGMHRCSVALDELTPFKAASLNVFIHEGIFTRLAFEHLPEMVSLYQNALGISQTCEGSLPGQTQVYSLGPVAKPARPALEKILKKADVAFQRSNGSDLGIAQEHQVADAYYSIDPRNIDAEKIDQISGGIAAATNAAGTQGAVKRFWTR